MSETIKLTTYFGERQRVDGRFLADVQLDVFGRHRLATSILLRGIGGFGAKQHLRTDRLLTLSEDLPVVSVAVDARDKIEAARLELAETSPRGLVTLERALLLNGDLDPSGFSHEQVKLTLYVGRTERVYRVPAFAAVCDLLHRRGLDGATVFLGVDGTNQGTRTRARFFGRNADVPMMIVSVGRGDRIARVLPELGGLLRRPLVTLERVRVCKRDGAALAPPPDHAPDWTKIMVYTSECALHDGEPVHRALVRRLRAARADGATVLRGIWGFRDAEPPHGDRVWQLGRRAPACTIAVSTPELFGDTFAVVDELTAEHGLVTCERVPRPTDR